jgi:hypothetical protein
VLATTLLTKLNELGRKHGIGRLDLVENRFVGMKSRGMYETPGGTIYALAHRGIEQITLDRGAAHLKDELYAELVYNGFWFSPEREMLQAAVSYSQEGDRRPPETVQGPGDRDGAQVALQPVLGKVVTFEDDQGAYDQRDAAASSSSTRCCACWAAATATDLGLSRMSKGRTGQPVRPFRAAPQVERSLFQFHAVQAAGGGDDQIAVRRHGQRSGEPGLPDDRISLPLSGRP